MKYYVVTRGLSLLLLLVFCPLAVAERINQEGRILGALPVVTNAILFDTSNADAVVSAMQIFPVTNPWNECISNRPVLVEFGRDDGADQFRTWAQAAAVLTLDFRR